MPFDRKHNNNIIELRNTGVNDVVDMIDDTIDAINPFSDW